MPARKKTIPRRRRSFKRKAPRGLTQKEKLALKELVAEKAEERTAKYGAGSYSDQIFDLQFGPPAAQNIAYGQLLARRADKYYGRGGYFDSMKKYGKWAARGLGGALTAGQYLSKGGSLAGAERAWMRGQRRGAKIAKIAGMGDYVSTNQIMSVDASNPQQNVHHVSTIDQDLSGDIVYSNSELVQNVYANVASAPSTSPFEIQSFSLNPGLANTFPFLSQLAQNFELYEFIGLSFQYKPTSGEFGNNSSNSLGKVVMCTNYDPDAAPFANTIVMENYDYACSTKPSCGCIHGVECDPAQRSTMQLYTRTGESSKDKVFTDLGNFQIATEGVPFGGTGAQTALIGELWVTYTVKMTRAKLYQAIGQSIPHWTALSSNSGGAWSAPVVDSGSSLVMESVVLVASPFGLQLTFPDDLDTGTYLVNQVMSGTADALPDFDIQAVANCSVVLAPQVPARLTNRKQLSAIVTIDSRGPANLASITTIPTGIIPPGDIHIQITKVDPDFVF